MFEWDLATKMKELSGSNAGTQDKLQRFEADIWPHLDEMRGQLPKYLWVYTMDFLTGVCDAVAQEGIGGISVRLSRMCARVGKLELGLRNQLVLSLCHRLVTEELSSSDLGANAILGELLDLWKHITQLRRPSQGYKAPLRFVLPSADEIFTVADAERRGSSKVAPATKALASVFIQFHSEEACALVPGLLATLAVLSDPQLTKVGRAAEAAPLLRLVATVLKQAMPDEAYVKDVFGGKMRFPPSKLPDLQAYVLAQWTQASTMLQDADAPWRHAGPETTKRPRGPASSGLGAFHMRIRDAYRSRNTGAIISVWQDVRARMAQKPHLVRQMREDPDFLDFCIFVWCAVRRPARLQETLHLMDEIQVQPTLKSYTEMMHGWKVCKETDKITALWDKLVESGMKLDAVIWTERISGLIEGGRPQAGLRAMAEMMVLWKQAVEQRGQDAAAAAVQPGIEVINAVVKGLIRLDVNAVSEVLAWASRHGLEPNVLTYNILIRQSFRSGAADDVHHLLRTMDSRGVEPNAATFTIILEEVLGAMHNASAAEQVQAVKQVLAEIEAAGLRANAETYGKMLYAVASLPNGGADEAIAAVQRHMRDAGLAVTPHMVTILLERALAREPPSAAVVQAILREHGLTSISQGDQTLWERVTSAHAVVGDTDAAMAVFADLTRAGRPFTSLPCLTDLVRALLAVERHADARDVVAATLAHKAAERGRGGLDGDRYWRHHFWHLVGVEGLLDWERVPLELQARLRESS